MPDGIQVELPMDDPAELNDDAERKKRFASSKAPEHGKSRLELN